MDVPGSSIFQGTDIQLNNSQNKEEEEDLEDQKRRNEELQNLLMAKLDDFNFDESTVNSSNNLSIMSNEDLQNKYRNVVEPNEQLKVLYEVRVREVNSLKEEFNSYKVKKAQEVEDLKRRLIISEGEIQQLKISLNSSESLLVEKTTLITELKATLDLRDETIKNYEKTVENLQLEMAAYQSTVNELQLKVADNENPFYLGAKKYNTEEMQRAHEEQVMKLETLLRDQTKLTTQLEKEKYVLESELQKLICSDNENRQAINILTDNFDRAQNQCMELIEIIEKLGNENHHLQERLKSTVETSPETRRKSMNNPLESQVEKLKKMLLDKSVHIETLTSKLINFENNIKELLEYRQIKTDIYNKKFQQCDDKEHTTCLLLMQNDLKNCQKMLEDKNMQILALSSNNKELLEKMEVLISQTRTDLHNFSYKYNMPQLEKMAEDLQSAQATISDLEERLRKSEADNANKENEHAGQLINLQNEYDKEKNTLQNRVAILEKDLDVSAMEIKNLKDYANSLVNENIKLKASQKETCSPEKNDRRDESFEVLKSGYLEAIQNLHISQEKVKTLEKTLCTVTDEMTRLKKEKDKCENLIQELGNELKQSRDTTKNIQNTLDKYANDSDEKENLLKKLQNELDELKEDLSKRSMMIGEMEKKNKELQQLLEKANNDVCIAKEEISGLQNKLRDTFKKKLESSFNRSEDNILGDGQDIEILTIESKLREEMQKEYFQKLNEMEHKYKEAASVKKDDHKKCLDKIKKLEQKHHEQMTDVLVECTLKLTNSEQEKTDLIKVIENMHTQHEQLKQQVLNVEELYGKLLETKQIEAEENMAKLKKWNHLQRNCIDKVKETERSLECMNQKVERGDSEIAAIEKLYKDKIKKYVKTCKM